MPRYYFFINENMPKKQLRFNRKTSLAIVAITAIACVWGKAMEKALSNQEKEIDRLRKEVEELKDQKGD